MKKTRKNDIKKVNICASVKTLFYDVITTDLFVESNYELMKSLKYLKC